MAEGSRLFNFDSYTEQQQEVVRTYYEERYLYYKILIHSGNQHRKLKVDLQNNFTIINNLLPNYSSQALHLLDKYSKIAAPNVSKSEGLLFEQGDVNKGNGGRGGLNNKGRDDKDYDKNYWKDKK